MPPARSYLGNISLSQLQTRIRTAEQAIGEVRAIGLGDHGKTAVAFGGEVPPLASTVLIAYPAHQLPNGPAGATEICKGKAYVNGTPTPVAAFRTGGA